MSRLSLIAVAAAVVLGVGWLVQRTLRDDEAAAPAPAARFAQTPAGEGADALPGRRQFRRSAAAARDAERSPQGSIADDLDARLQRARHSGAFEGRPRQSEDAGVADADGRLFAPFDVVDRGEDPIEATFVEFEPGAGVVLGDDSELIFPTEGNVDGTAGTINFTIEPDWEGGDDSNRELVSINRPGDFQNRIRVFKNGEFLRYMFIDAEGADRNLTFSIAEWHPGEPHQVTATWGEGRLVLYVDGAEAAKLDFNGQLALGPEAQLALGSTGIDGFAAAGARITDFTVYDRPLSPGEM